MKSKGFQKREVEKVIRRLEIYKCEICGNIVEVLHPGLANLVCCGKQMDLAKEKTEDQGKEKHVPVLEKTDSGIKVKVGSIPHPMEEKHYIEFIEIETLNGVFRKFLRPGDIPEAIFEINDQVIKVREYCTIHGLWIS